MTEANLLTVWATLLLESLADAGVRDVIISPGSRSTPFVVAAVRATRLTRHVVIDERAAAFFALGQARVTGRPSVLICTSGVAVAHYLPAIIEAGMTGTPMIVLSGDRPHELYDCGALQTIDQVKLFGEHVRQFFDLVPDALDGSLRALRRVAAQAVLTASWPLPGAVHMNARARKPLEPVGPTNEAEVQLAERAHRISAEPLTKALRPRAIPAPDAIEAAVAVIRVAERGVIVAGPAAISQRDVRGGVWALALATGFAIACEATSQLRLAPKQPGIRFVDGFELLLRSSTFRKSAPFDVAIQIGAPLTSGHWEQIAPTIPRIVLAENGWPDPHSNARVIVIGDVGASSAALVNALRVAAPAAPIASGSRELIEAANAEAWRTTERELGECHHLIEAAAVRALIDRLPDRSLLMLGNSLAVRLVDIYTRAVDRDVDVLSQRGASGIDGLVAGAVGAATAAPGRSLTLVIGDVSLLHDLTSLGLAARIRTPFVIFVLHNGGGRIFEQLPIVDVPGIEPEIVEHATTPHDTDFAPTAALYDLRYTCATNIAEVHAALDAAYAHPGCTLVEVRVERSGAIAFGRRVASAIEAAVAPLVRRPTEAG